MILCQANAEALKDHEELHEELKRTKRDAETTILELFETRAALLLASVSGT